MSNAHNQYGTSTTTGGSTWKSFLAWAAIILGVLGVVSGIMTLTIGSVLLGVGLVIPGAWYLRCASKDTKEQKFYEESVKAYSIIGQDEAFINKSQPTKRHWGVVSLISAVVMFVGGSLGTPTPVEADNETPATTTQVTTTPETTTTEPTSSTRPSPTTDAEKAEREAEASRRAEAEAETERIKEQERIAEEARQEEIRRMEEERARLERENELLRQQQEQQQQHNQQQQYGFAPQAPAGNVSYANCSEARAAGAAPIYAGEPGYARKLDRDGDGIACE